MKTRTENTILENIETVERERERERATLLFNVEFVYSTIEQFIQKRISKLNNRIEGGNTFINVEIKTG